jgi:hypothetical protein
MKKRLPRALVGYGVFAVLALLTLDGKLQIFILILMAALAVKTWLAAKREEQP